MPDKMEMTAMNIDRIWVWVGRGASIRVPVMASRFEELGATEIGVLGSIVSIAMYGVRRQSKERTQYAKNQSQNRGYQ